MKDSLNIFCEKIMFLSLEIKYGKGKFMNIELTQPPKFLKLGTIFLRICFPAWFWHRV